MPHSEMTEDTRRDGADEMSAILAQCPLLLRAWKEGSLTPQFIAAIRENPKLAASMERAFQRGEESVRQILSDASMLRLRPFAERLKFAQLNLNSFCRCRAVNSMRIKHEILALHQKKYARYLYPVWQINPQTHEVYPAIAGLFKILSHPLAVYNFLMNRNSAFDGRTGLDIMRLGNFQRLYNAAEAQARGDFN